MVAKTCVFPMVYRLTTSSIRSGDSALCAPGHTLWLSAARGHQIHAPIPAINARWGQIRDRDRNDRTTRTRGSSGKKSPRALRTSRRPEKFQREREAYYAATMESARANRVEQTSQRRGCTAEQPLQLTKRRSRQPLAAVFAVKDVRPPAGKLSNEIARRPLTIMAEGNQTCLW